MSKGIAKSKIETIKENSRYLKDPILGELENKEASFSNEAAQLLKFHGIYQQDDRDLRKARRAKGLNPAFQFMVRVGSAAGAYSASQILAMLALCEELGNGTIRLTSRQTVQFHGVAKAGLKPLIRGLSKELLSSFAKCGDVVRNVTLCPAPPEGDLSKILLDTARSIEEHFRPRTKAYLEIWLDGELAVSAGDVEEPLYGKAYLPRKFKIGIASPFDNCVDVYTDDIGIVPVPKDGGLEGFILLVGGGMGFSHGERTTYPKLADPVGFIPPKGLLKALEAIVTIQRDFGDRSDRAHARMKYTLDRLGLLGFRSELEKRLGNPLFPARKPLWSGVYDHLGWHTLQDGRLSLGIPIPSGRVQDTPGVRLKSALIRLLKDFKPEVRLTPQQNLLLFGIEPGQKPKVQEVLRECGVEEVEKLKPFERTSLACPALPTCGLAIAEAERALPGLLEEIHAVLEEFDLQNEPLSIRMTGCPNSCARPLTAEVGIVGRGLDSYNIYLGGSHLGTRLGALFMEKVPRQELALALRPVFYLWSQARMENERFGDFYNRVGLLPLRNLAVREMI